MVIGKAETYSGRRTIEVRDSDDIMSPRLFLEKSRGIATWVLCWRERVPVPGREWPTTAEALIATGLTLRQAKAQAAQLLASGKPFPYPEWQLYSPYTGVAVA